MDHRLATAVLEYEIVLTGQQLLLFQRSLLLSLSGSKQSTIIPSNSRIIIWERKTEGERYMFHPGGNVARL
jgi:hypothetical protein